MDQLRKTGLQKWQTDEPMNWWRKMGQGIQLKDQLQKTGLRKWQTDEPMNLWQKMSHRRRQMNHLHKTGLLNECRKRGLRR